LSYNKLGGKLDGGQFEQLHSLYDLYLGHNLIESIGQFAFVGLRNLQILELQWNRLTLIESGAFSHCCLTQTLLELNVAHNEQLAQLPLPDHMDNQLQVLKAFGNPELRRLPSRLNAIRKLSLTYAYHCCDFLASSTSGWPVDASKTSDSKRENIQKDAQEEDIQQEDSEKEDAQEASYLVQQSPTGQEEGPAQWWTRESLLEHLVGLLFGGGTNGKNSPTSVAGSPQTVSQESGPNASAQWTQLGPAGRPLPVGVGSKRGPIWGEAEEGEATLEGAGGLRELVLVLRPWKKMKNSATQLGGGATASGGEQWAQLAHRAGPNSSAWAANDDHYRWGLGATSGAASSFGAERRPSEAASGHHQGDELLSAGGPQLRVRPTGQPTTKEAPPTNELAGVIDELTLAAAAERWSAVATGARRQLPARRRRHSNWAGGSQSPFAGSQSNLGAPHEHQADGRLLLLLARSLGLRPLDSRPLEAAGSGAPASRGATLRTLRTPGRAQRVECAPQPNAFMPCQDLFDSWWLRLGVWLVFGCSFAGNLLVLLVMGSVRPSSSSSALANIMWLAGHSKRHIDVPRFLVLNLAFADLLMAVYLGLLALVDAHTLGEFRLHAIRWQYSAGCRLAAFLAVLSSELSVFILAIITLERSYAITNAVHLNRRLSLQKAVLIMLFGYTFALVMALAPVQGVSEYRKFAVCLPLDFETNPWSRVYVLTLISINALSFLLLLSCYLRMYCAIRGSQAWNTNDLRIAKRMSVLILTDFLCWMPVILVACFALAGHHLVGPRGLKVMTIFVLPLNSVANPFLYAITTKKFKRDLAILRRRLAKLASGKRQQAQTNELPHHVHPQPAHRRPLQPCQQAALELAAEGGSGALLRVCGPQAAAGELEARARLAERPLRCHKGGPQRKPPRGRPRTRRGGKWERDPGRLVAGFEEYQEQEQEDHVEEEPQNMVTVNRTTAAVCCSCGRLLGAPQAGGAPQVPQGEYEGEPSGRQQVAVQVRLSAASSKCALADSGRTASGQETRAPTILLEAALCEPALDVALAPLLLGRETPACPAAVGAPPASFQGDFSASSPTGTSSGKARRSQRRGASAEPSGSALAGAASQGDAKGASWHAALLWPGARADSAATLRQRQLAPAAEQPDRCASACASAPSSRPAHCKPGGAATTRNAADPKGRHPFGGSCNLSSFGPTGSSRAPSPLNQQAGRTRLSRSISRLLSNPIARAWSSIQSISLQSIGVVAGSQAGAEQQQQQREQEQPNRKSQSAQNGHLEQCHCRHNYQEHNGHLFGASRTAVLQDMRLTRGSRHKRNRHNQGRRMSRSCDQLTSTTTTHTTLVAADQSTTITTSTTTGEMISNDFTPSHTQSIAASTTRAAEKGHLCHAPQCLHGECKTLLVSCASIDDKYRKSLSSR